MAGLEARYDVKKINDPEDKHAGCRYFVLDPQHDPMALLALRTYANFASLQGLGELAEDLNDWITEILEKEKDDA